MLKHVYYVNKQLTILLKKSPTQTFCFFNASLPLRRILDPHLYVYYYFGFYQCPAAFHKLVYSILFINGGDPCLFVWVFNFIIQKIFFRKKRT